MERLYSTRHLFWFSTFGGWNYRNYNYLKNDLKFYLYKISKKMVFIYTLQLEKGKYYVGKTNNPQFRLESHFNSNGSEWTKLYKPLKVL